MCVLAFAWHAHPHWPLLCIGNRDEYHDRPAAPLARWEEPAGVLAGRDLRSGGIWMGASEQGRFAIVTNVRGFDGGVADRVSRGTLVFDQLTGSGAYGDAESAALDDFNPFNLIVVNQGGARFLTNRPDIVRTRLTHGLYGVSNGALDEPWPKTLRIKAHLLDWIVGDAQDPARLLDALREEALPRDGIPARIASDIDEEALQSSIFIRNPVYGTRCSTVLAVNATGQGVMIERRYDAQARRTGETALTFDWPHSFAP